MYYYVRRAVPTQDGALCIPASIHFHKGHASAVKTINPGDTDYPFFFWLHTNYPKNAPASLDVAQLDEFRHQYNDATCYPTESELPLPVFIKPPVNLKGLLMIVALMIPMSCWFVVLIGGQLIYGTTRRPFFFLRKRLRQWWGKMRG